MIERVIRPESGGMLMTEIIKSGSRENLIVIRPVCELQGRTERMDEVLDRLFKKLDMHIIV